LTTYQDLLRRAVATLKTAGINDPARDARTLLAHALKIERGRLGLMLGDSAAAFADDGFVAMIRQRASHVPVSRIIGYRDFYGRRFAVGPAVLDPRPETECLVERALETRFRTALDLGTGSGCILLTLLAECPGSSGVGTDLSPTALALAGANARALGVGDRLQLIESDWFGAVGGRFDLIVSNPPYIAAAELPGLQSEVRDHDPRMALTDGGDGLGAFRAIAAGAAAHLAKAGCLMVEIGPTQGGAVRSLLAGQGFAEIRIWPDLDGRDRVVSARQSD